MTIGEDLLVDPGHGGRLPVDELVFLEPESNFLLGRLDRVTSVADVAANLHQKISQ